MWRIGRSRAIQRYLSILHLSFRSRGRYLLRLAGKIPTGVYMDSLNAPTDQQPSIVPDDLIDEFCSVLFESLPRRDQRVTGERYLRGLISVQGRKTMRSIAQFFGGGAEQQKIQHFISNSSWDWMRLRLALLAYLEDAMRPQAWVVRQMVVPKSGMHSVGVERSFVRGLGQTLNVQRAFGAWFASETMSVPVNWKLFLPESWLKDDERRRRAGIPESCTQEFPQETASRSVLEMLEARPGSRSTPVVLDFTPPDIGACLRRFDEAKVPVILQIQGGIRVLAEQSALPVAKGSGDVPARRLSEMLRTQRRPTQWSDPHEPSPRRSCAVAVRVSLPAPGGRPLPLRLLAEWDRPGRRPDRLWVASLTDHSTAELLRLTKLVQRVDHDFAKVSKRVGIQDFEGRSFQGWHRHLSLASAAHAVAMLEIADALN
jgi:hypothetical protein